MPRDSCILLDLWAVLDPDSAIGSRQTASKMLSDKAAQRKKDQRVRDNAKLQQLIRAHKVRGEKAIVKQGLLKGWRPIVEADSSEDEDMLEIRYPTDPAQLKGYYTTPKLGRPAEA